MFSSPYSTKTSVRVTFKLFRASTRIILRHRPRQYSNICNSKVHSLRTCSRYDVCSITCKEESPILHWFNNKTPHWADALLKDRAFLKPDAVTRAETHFEFFPDSFVRPLLEVFIRLTLNLQTRDLW